MCACVERDGTKVKPVEHSQADTLCVTCTQVSLSDDELEYSSAGRTSGSGGGKGRTSMDGKPAQVGLLLLCVAKLEASSMTSLLEC
jgi:hypothetical protein